MGTIIARGDKWRAVVRRKGVTKTKTFDKVSHARRWMNEIEHKLDEQLSIGRHELLRDILDDYRTKVVDMRPYPSKTPAHLKMLARMAGNTTVGDCTPEWWVSFVQQMACSPASRNRYVSLLSSALKTAEGLWHVNVDWPSYRRGRTMMAALQLTRAGSRRKRRASEEEIAAVKKAASTSLPLADLIDFAIDSAMRDAEICRIVRPDYSKERRMVWIRNRKHPRKKMGNDWHVPLLGRCIEIIERQPVLEDEPRIFPFKSETIGNAFWRACRTAGVEDLHFHDLRHEGISRLFERGFSIQEVALVSGHTDWSSLKIYTQLNPEALHLGPVSSRIEQQKEKDR